jgi:hypothetical protein
MMRDEICVLPVTRLTLRYAQNYTGGGISMRYLSFSRRFYEVDVMRKSVSTDLAQFHGTLFGFYRFFHIFFVSDLQLIDLSITDET